jgi:hypothetical protein
VRRVQEERKPSPQRGIKTDSQVQHQVATYNLQCIHNPGREQRKKGSHATTNTTSLYPKHQLECTGTENEADRSNKMAIAITNQNAQQDAVLTIEERTPGVTQLGSTTLLSNGNNSSLSAA